ncbi:MAG: acetate/propionate family kinase [Cellvibrionaceae bacterium]|nr:acetate/propionate family kinase [Cellvibrionaceae bacterium]MCV6624652.1 acetate/propionate family kinase [Cellvibrionaceae bacterium]
MAQLLLTVNAGSSSLKCGLFSSEQQQSLLRFKFGDVLGRAKLKIIPGSLAIAGEEIELDCAEVASDQRHLFCLQTTLQWIEKKLPDARLAGICHRIVHGGERFYRPQKLSAEVIAALEEFIPLAPLHQPFNLKLVATAQTLRPELPQFACFDTMFHVGQSKLERYYAIDQKYSEAGIHRYGFHGLSYEYILQRLTQLDPETEGKKIIVCHLGAGASMCAIAEGRSQASSMGFSAVDGLPMGSRSGAIDPGVLLYLQRHYGMDANQLEQFLYKDSGWKGVSGISAEMKTLAASSDPNAKLAIDMFCYRAALEIGRLSAAIEGIDTLVFTGGVGENDAAVRAQISRRCQWLGLRLDEQANSRAADIISRADSKLCARVIPTNEEAIMAQHGFGLLTD